MWQSLIIGASFLLILTQAAPADDLIKVLPGLAKQPSWNQYSGYLTAGGTRKLHYWFVESAKNPKKDPVVLWLNGGPGCSSDLGLLTEHGPFRVQDDGATLLYNPFSWNNVANMIYLEAPAGVGYSYSDDGDYSTNDDQTAKDNYLALKDFFTKFPEFASNEFFITGESYGGVYVPTLSVLVLDDKDINFQGFAVGNGLSSAELNDDSLIYFAYYHGLLGETLWDNIVDICCNGDSTNCTFSQNARGKPDCAQFIGQVQALAWSSGLNVYNLYGSCAGGVDRTMVSKSNITGTSVVSANFGWNFPWLPRVQKEREWIKNLPRDETGRLSVTPPCINATGPLMYMNSADVRTALHIPPQLPKWDVCSDILHYKMIYNDLSPQYQKILDGGKRVLVYNGDVDMACNFLGDEWFVDRLIRPIVKERSEWFFTDAHQTKQVAGFVKQFERLTFLTVRGAGHMVPTDRPRPALEMFTKFLLNQIF
ncbi:hypothetical protein C0Q70_12431 [Pomacea canaliculata]|uniref:Carboxypeptidase n=1 Tax=Pomacea canaliculata TaxID=400727 RepID=A0A2T7P1J1_POMCA|nr:lysosomal protective protein-like [Pomacea canaliculata]PVD27276.1 hypothetical protein C0Q70_12431 [Pomacea canaliculata]